MNNTNSISLFETAKQYIPGGVNSPVRTFNVVGGNPVFIEKASGSILYDADGNEYIDYLGSWGPMIFGHAWPPLVEAVSKQLIHSSSYGLASKQEVELAKLIVEMVPGIDKVRLVNSGTEACMTAIRIARGFTGRDKIVKFKGCYHGHADSFLMSAGSGVATLGKPSSLGVTNEIAKHTLLAEYNSLADLEQIISINKGEIAAIIVEPVAGNMGCIPPAEGFLDGLRELANEHSIVLIFDEVMTGFRLSPGGAQEYFGVFADLVTFGKIIGGGFPVGAIAGRDELMNMLAPEGSVYQAGTLSGNPIATTAGITILSELRNNPEIYIELDRKSVALEAGLLKIFDDVDISVKINRVGSMISLFFTEEDVLNFDDAKNADHDLFSAFFHEMLKQGIHLPPSGYESWFLATTITEEMIAATISAAQKSAKNILVNIE